METVPDNQIDSRKRIVATCALLAIISVVCFLNVFKNDFVGYDDQNLIQNNTAIRSLSPANIGQMFVPKRRGGYQPIRVLSYAVDYALWGPGPFGFHLTNIILHALTVIGVWFLLRLLAREPMPLVAAFLFAVHPIHVESVTWMSARKDVLCLALFLFAILSYERSADGDRRLAYATSLVATLLALLSKVSAVTIPACIVLVEICREEWPSVSEWRRKLIRLSPHVALVILVVAVNFVQTGPATSHGDALKSLADIGTPVVRDVWLSVPLVVCRYIGLLWMPVGLNTHYEIARVSEIADPRFLIPVGLLAASIVIGIMCLLRGRKLIAFAVGWFFISYLPMSNIVPTAAMMTDRYMHIPSIGFVALLAALLTWPLRTLATGECRFRHVRLLPIVLIVLLLSVLTIFRNADWRDTRTLFTRTLERNPQSVDARLALGFLLDRDGDYDSAIKMYREAIEIEPHNSRVRHNLGLTYLQKGWIWQGTKILKDLRDQEPGSASARFGLALAHMKGGDYGNAIDELRESIEIRPGYAAAHGLLGRAYLETGEIDRALEELNRALELAPDLIQARIDRARLLISQGRSDEAADDIRRLEEIGVDSDDIRPDDSGMSSPLPK